MDVEGNGTGISLENLSRIFDASFTTKPSRKGTGKGLGTIYTLLIYKHRKTLF
jgi:signal transduction histidine kinase